jgi:hypothetical protein
MAALSWRRRVRPARELVGFVRRTPIGLGTIIRAPADAANPAFRAPSAMCRRRGELPAVPPGFTPHFDVGKGPIHRGASKLSRVIQRGA